MVTDTVSVFRDCVGTSEPHASPVDLHQQNTGSSAAEMPFSQDGQLTYRKAEQPVSLHEIPLGKGHLKTDQENELRKYIMKVCRMIV
jgi:hypothetical protein